MSVRLDYDTRVTVGETLETNASLVSATGNKVTYNGVDTQLANQLSTSTPPVSKAAVFPQALSAGLASIDLTALPGTNGAVVDGTGLRVQAMKIRASAENVGPITIAFGSETPCDAFGITFSMTLAPEAEATFLTKDSGHDISASYKLIDLSGTGTDSVDVAIVMG